MAKKPIVPTGSSGVRPSRPAPPPIQVMMKRADDALNASVLPDPDAWQAMSKKIGPDRA